MTCQSQLDSEQAALQAKAEETSTDLATVNAQLEAARAAQKKQEEEAQRKADEQLAKKAQEETKQASASAGSNTSAGNNNPSNNNSSNNTSSDSSNSGSGGYVIPSGGLTPSKGRIWYNGHTETYYSQKVLPGGGLAIPGRHIASDGTIRMPMVTLFWQVMITREEQL